MMFNIGVTASLFTFNLQSFRIPTNGLLHNSLPIHDRVHRHSFQRLEMHKIKFSKPWNNSFLNAQGHGAEQSGLEQRIIFFPCDVGGEGKTATRTRCFFQQPRGQFFHRPIGCALVV